jgi:hypothetical protein
VKAPDGNQATTLANMLTGPDPVLDDKIFGVRDRRLDAVVTASQFVREARSPRSPPGRCACSGWPTPTPPWTAPVTPCSARSPAASSCSTRG